MIRRLVITQARDMREHGQTVKLMAGAQINFTRDFGAHATFSRDQGEHAHTAGVEIGTREAGADRLVLLEHIAHQEEPLLSGNRMTPPALQQQALGVDRADSFDQSIFIASRVERGAQKRADTGHLPRGTARKGLEQEFCRRIERADGLIAQTSDEAHAVFVPRGQRRHDRHLGTGAMQQQTIARLDLADLGELHNGKIPTVMRQLGIGPRHRTKPAAIATTCGQRGNALGRDLVIAPAENEEAIFHNLMRGNDRATAVGGFDRPSTGETRRLDRLQLRTGVHEPLPASMRRK
jgi:hypothetical protein